MKLDQVPYSQKQANRKNRETGLAKTVGRSVIISNSIIKSDLKSENAIEFHLKRRKSQKKRPYRSIPNAIWTLFCLRRIQPENRTNTI